MSSNSQSSSKIAFVAEEFNNSALSIYLFDRAIHADGERHIFRPPLGNEHLDGRKIKITLTVEDVEDEREPNNTER